MHDIGIAGLENIPLAPPVHSRLTTIEIPAYDIGQQAAFFLMGYIKKRRKRKRARIADTTL